MSADVVIDKIREKSAAEVQSILQNGEREAAAQTDAVLAHAREQAAAVVARAEKRADAVREGERLQAGLEQRKQTLTVKRQMLDEAYAAVGERLRALPDDAWGRQMTALVRESGVSGDATVRPAASEAKRQSCLAELCKEWSRFLSEQTGKACGFTVGEPTDRIASGVLLEGAKYDIELSFEQYLSALRERTEASLAARLFPEETA